ncbi:MAG: hypothetical protein EBZ49_00220 [Proteobacteria bacterium]|nr:hypothetical protein [Pseudomonadota bacterium]
MVTPYELYVRFLITKGCSESEINSDLKKLSLQPLPTEEFSRHYDLVHSLTPTAISNQIISKKHEKDFMRWMHTLEVGTLWEEKDTKLVFDIHSDLKLRMTINALIMKNTGPTDICQLVNAKFSYMLKAEHIVLYNKYFWDPRRMTRAAWKAYLVGCGDFERNILFTALTEPADIVKTLLDLPSKVNVSDSLQYMFMNSYQKAKHYLRLNTKESNAEARAWIAMSLTLADKYEKHRKGDLEDFSKALQMEFEFIDSAFPTPDEGIKAELLKQLEKTKEAI